MSILQDMMTVAELAGVPLASVRPASKVLTFFEFTAQSGVTDTKALTVPGGYVFLAVDARVLSLPAADLGGGGMTAIPASRQPHAFADFIDFAAAVESNQITPSDTHASVIYEGEIFQLFKGASTVTMRHTDTLAHYDDTLTLNVRLHLRGFLLPESAEGALSGHTMKVL